MIMVMMMVMIMIMIMNMMMMRRRRNPRKTSQCAERPEETGEPVDPGTRGNG